MAGRKRKRVRRAKGEGSVYKFNESLWAASVTVGYVNGKRKRATLYAQTEREALELRDQARQALKENRPARPERMTVEAFLKSWLEEIAKRNTRPKTYSTYSDHVRLHLIPGLGKTALGKLSTQEIQTFLNSKTDSGLSPKTVKHIRDCLRAALSVAVDDWHLIANNPAKKARPPRVVSREMLFLNIEQARTFMSAARASRLEALFDVALLLGMRQAELLGLRWNDIDFEKGVLNVRCSLQWIPPKVLGKKHGEFRLVETKSEKGVRPLTMPAFVMQALLRHQAMQVEQRLAADMHWKEWNLVFCTSRGTPIHRRNLLRVYYRLIRDLPIPKIRFHDLRHSCAAIYIAEGISPKALQELLGHADFATTMNIYGHLFESVKREMAAKVDALFDPLALKLALPEASGKPN